MLTMMLGVSDCAICQYKCATCLTSEENCLSCSGIGRTVLSTSYCYEGYFESDSNNPVCGTCSYHCKNLCNKCE